MYPRTREAAISPASPLFDGEPRCSDGGESEFGKMVADETAKWAKVVKAAGLKVE